MQMKLLLDLSSLMAVPSLRVFCLESIQTLDEDPEGLLQASSLAGLPFVCNQVDTAVLTTREFLIKIIF